MDVEADLVLETPLGLGRFEGRGRALRLTLPLGLSFRQLMRARRLLASGAARRASRAMADEGLSVRVYWRDEAVLDVGREAGRSGWLQRLPGRAPIRARYLALGRAVLKRPS